MSDEQDKRLREALRGLQPPPPDAETRERVRAAVAKAAAEATRAPAAATPADAARPRSWLRHPFAVFARHRGPALGLAALAIVALVAGVLLVGTPGGGGPEPVSAGHVLQRALRALSSGRTLSAEVIVTTQKQLGWTTEPDYDVDRYRLWLKADGSYRLTGLGPSRIFWLPRAGSHPPVDVVFDASTGVLTTYSPGRGVVEHAGYPPGPPDRWAGLVTEYDFSAAGRALQALGGARPISASYERRPAWVLTCSLYSGPSRPAITDEGFHFEITIDKATAFPVCFKGFLDDDMMLEVRYRDVRVNAPLPDDAFALEAPTGAPVKRVQDGFRRMTVAEIARLPGYTTLVPARVPRGYGLTSAAAAAHAVTANRLVRGRNVVALQYSRGFDSLTVTTRRVADPWLATEYDPLELDQSWARQVAWPAVIPDGAFRGVTAQVVVAPVTTTPHLWAVKDGVLLTVAGAASAEELVAVAASLEPASR